MRDSVLDRIEEKYWYITDPRMDGFSQWGRKQILYQILWKAQWALDKCPTFYGEEDWVKENKPSLVTDTI